MEVSVPGRRVGNEELKTRLRDNYQLLVNDVDAEEMYDGLIARKVLTVDKRNKLKKEPDAKDAMRGLLDGIIYSKHPSCCNDFVAILREKEQYSYLVEMIGEYLR